MFANQQDGDRMWHADCLELFGLRHPDMTSLGQQLAPGDNGMNLADREGIGNVSETLSTPK